MTPFIQFAYSSSKNDVINNLDIGKFVLGIYPWSKNIYLTARNESLSISINNREAFVLCDTSREVIKQAKRASV